MLTADQLRAALAHAFNLGSTYWRQADSESYAQNRRSDDTGAKFEALVTETVAALAVQGTSSALSNFIRNATPEEKAKVYGAVMDKVSEQQRAVIDCVPPCPNASMAGGCPCGYADCTKRPPGVTLPRSEVSAPRGTDGGDHA